LDFSDNKEATCQICQRKYQKEGERVCPVEKF